jgi:hypothetical protein
MYLQVHSFAHHLGMLKSKYQHSPGRLAAPIRVRTKSSTVEKGPGQQLDISL